METQFVKNKLCKIYGFIIYRSFAKCVSPELLEEDRGQSTQLSKMFSELSDIVDCGYIFHYLYNHD